MNSRPWRIWCGGRSDRIGWFRLLGYGLAWADHRLHPPLLSERYAGQHGFRRGIYLHVGSWCIQATTWRHP